MIIGGGALVLIGAALGITGAVLSSNYSPQAQAKEFLTALAEGRADDAVGLLDSKPSGPSLITDAAYATATDRIQSFTIDETVTDGDSATVLASLQQGSASSRVEFSLVQDGKTGPLDLFPLWRVEADVLPTVEVIFDRPAEIGLAANGRPVPGVEDAEPVTVTVLPGTWEFSASEAHEYFEYTPAQATVGFATSDSVEIFTTLSEAGTAAARAAVDAFVATCGSGSVMDPGPGCGMLWEATPGETYSNSRWSVTRAPVYEIGPWFSGGADVEGSVDAGYRLDADVVTATQYGTVWWTWDVRIGGTVWFRDGVMVYESNYN